MAKFIISIGLIPNKIHFSALYLVFYLIFLIFLEIAPKNNNYNEDVKYFASDIGLIVSGIIIHYVTKNKKKRMKRKKKFIYKFFLFLSRFISYGLINIYKYIIPITVYLNRIISSSIDTLEIIILTLITFYFLKYKCYIHHIISILIFCIFSVIIDSILGNFSLINYKYIYIDILMVINEVIYICYVKYMIDKLYYQFWSIIVIVGISNLIVHVFYFILISIIQYENNIDGIVFNIKNYFSETKIIYIIFIIIYFLIDGFFDIGLQIIIINYLTPNLLLAINVLIRMLLIFYKTNSENKWFCIIFFFFQILSLLFYLEILEYNFCNLNLNTKKNILKREKNDFEINDSFRSENEILDDDSNDINDNADELYEKKNKNNYEENEENPNAIINNYESDND